MTVTWSNRMRQVSALVVPRAEQLGADLATTAQATTRARAKVDTGHMRASTQARRVGPGDWELTCGAEYGRYQNDGYHRGGREYPGDAWFTGGIELVATNTLRRQNAARIYDLPGGGG